jgi:hypothetical protein
MEGALNRSDALEEDGFGGGEGGRGGGWCIPLVMFDLGLK